MRLIKLLKSRRFAVYLLGLITGILILGSFAPNPLFVSPAEAEQIKNSPVLNLLSKLNPMELSKTWFFYVLFLVLASSIIACTLDRLKFRHRFPTASQGITAVEYRGGAEEAAAKLSAILEKQKWRVYISEDKREVLAKKGFWGFWGSVLFHASILLLVLGGLFTATGSFLAGLVVTEGQTLPLARENLVDVVRLPRGGFNGSGLSVRLDTFVPELKDGTAVRYTAGLTVMDSYGNQSYKMVGINDALTYKGYRFMLENYGFAPWFEIEDTRTNKIVVDSYINLVGRYQGEHDVIVIPGTDINLRTYVFPDFQLQGDNPVSKSVLPNNPVYKLVFIKGKEFGKEGLLPLHQELRLDNYIIRFKDLRYWTSFKVSSDPGEMTIFVGIILVCFGLALRFMDPRRAISLKISEQEDSKTLVTAGGYHNYAPNLFREKVAELLEKLK